jgi:hypothetical protein
MVLFRSSAGSRLAAALAILSASTLACSDAAAPAKARPGSLGAGTPGAQAAVDASGRLRAPTPDEARALSLMLSAELAAAPSRPLQAVRLANGALALQLDESFQSTLMATSSGGEAHAACVGSAAETGGAPGLAPAGLEDR